MTAQTQSTVSVIVPVRNEVKCIDRMLDSILTQRAPGFELEFLIVDGDSDDGTSEHIRQRITVEARAKLLRNARRTTPVALNLGLEAARGEYVAILGAHAIYPPDYIATCLQEMLRRDAVGCSGSLTMAPANDGPQARLAAWTMASVFASSRGSMRTRSEGYAETIPFPVMRRAALLAAGGYDEGLVRNQDNDMNQRLSSMGHRLYLTDKTRARYLGPPSIAAFLRHAFRTGYWNALTVRRNRASLSTRHFMPFAFSATLLTAAILGVSYKPAALLAAAIVALHLACGLLASTSIAVRERSAWPAVLAPVILCFHLCYGFGTLVGLAAALKKTFLVRAAPSPSSRPA